MITDLEDFKIINGTYPHIANRLRDKWGQPEFADLVRDMSNPSGGAGFPAEIKLSLNQLLALHDREFKPKDDDAPQKPVGTDPASNENIKIVNEQYPRVGGQLIEKWGTAAFSPYVNELMHDSRGGKRAGFSDTAAMALFRLMMQHDNEFPQFEMKLKDIWSVNYGG